ncbi:hypothetical protein SESBI_46038 [Sesbania bispinosa]|nr:hypothetical protein SESBI_46038 [Sesbania bispinosa]
MGLNPPFGLKAALANKFIDKALEFEPKLLILIVPPETERLDKKRLPYDLVWEDDKFLAGKSFYLPGSVDTYDKQMVQWNKKPPPVYLWSRRDWTDKHMVIAREHGHLISQHTVSKMESFDNEKATASHTMDDNYGDDLMKSTDDEDQTSMHEGQKGSSIHENVDRESQEREEYWVSKAEKTSWKRKRTEENDRRGPAVTSPAKRQAINQMPERVLDRSISNPVDGRSSVEGFQPKSDMIPPYSEVSDNGCRQHLEPSLDFGVAYDGAQKWPSVPNPLSDYGVTDKEEHHSSLLGDSSNSIGRRPYIREDDMYLRELETRQQVPFYGLQNPDYMRSNYLSGHDPAYSHMGSSYSVLGSVSEPSYMMNSPAMQRYAPRLDELNHVRMNSLGSEPPIIGRNGISERNVPQPGYRNGLLGFAAGPHHLYSRQNSAGRFQ